MLAFLYVTILVEKLKNKKYIDTMIESCVLS